MVDQRSARSGLDVEDIRQTLCEMEWLLITLVLVFYVLRDTALEHGEEVVLGMVVYTVFIVFINYVIPGTYRNRFLIAVETWVMIALITWVLYWTSQPGNVAATLYVLPIIVSALTLGKRITVVHVALAAACYIAVAQIARPDGESMLAVGRFAIDMAPIVLVAYITGTLSTELVGAMHRIKVASNIDELTGVYNLRAFKLAAEYEFAHAARLRKDFSLLMIDVDRLKPTNDEFGHDAGDRLIQRVAEAIKEVTKSTDVVARYGGDEFILVLPGAGHTAARSVAARIREKLATTPLVAADQAIPVTVSIGIACYPSHGDTLKAVIKNADAALYVSKENGRDRITLYEAPSSRLSIVRATA